MFVQFRLMRLGRAVYTPAAAAVWHVTYGVTVELNRGVFFRGTNSKEFCSPVGEGYAGTKFHKMKQKGKNKEEIMSRRCLLRLSLQEYKAQNKRITPDELSPHRPLIFASGSNPKQRFTSHPPIHPSIPSISQPGCIALWLLAFSLVASGVRK